MPDSRLPIRNDAEWPVAALRDVCDLITRGRAPTYVESSNTWAIGQRCVTDDGFDPSFARPHDQRRLSGMLKPLQGDVLLNSTGTGTIGRSCTFVAGRNFVVDGHVTLVRPKPHKADGRWIESLLRSPWGQAHLEARCFSGSTNQVELSRAELAGSLIPLPPLSEQRRIADMLDGLDEVIRSTDRLIAKLTLTRRGLLADLLTRGVGPDGALRGLRQLSGETGHPRFGCIPADWEVSTVGDVLEGIDAGWSPECVDSPPLGKQWGVLKVSAVSSGGFLPVESKTLPPGLSPRPDLEVHDGDVLCVRANGVAELVGRVALVEATPPRLMLSDKTLRLRPGPRVDPIFLTASMGSPRFAHSYVD